jgi:zinc/manganese transport system substrate-binding protein
VRRSLILDGRRAIGALAALAIAGGCASDDAGASVEATDVIDIVVTTTILGDIVSEAVGDAARVEVVMPAGADPHEFALSARQAESMERADLLVVNGRGLEAGMTDVIESVADRGTPVFVAAGHVADVAADPHIWMDPLAVRSVVEALESELVARDADANLLSTSIDRYLDQLDTLDGDIAATLADIPDARRIMVTNHDAFGYFADRYGLEIVGTVIPSMSTNAAASAADLEALVATIRTTGVPAVFAETTEPERLADAVAREVGDIDGTPVVVIELFSGSLGDAGSGGETYLAMMRTNAERIASALG